MLFDDTYVRYIYNFLQDNNFQDIVPFLTRLTDVLFWLLQAVLFFGFINLVVRFFGKGGNKFDF